jgi:tetratricopeptide (TPR) repeat protein
MSAVTSERPGSLPLKPIIVLGVMGFVLALRLAHLASAGLSPLSYQPGPDEEYYLRFGQAVAAGVGEDSPEFTFMDPAYGYLLGVVFKLAGGSLFVVYALQCLLDTLSAYGIFVIGRLLGRQRAGLYGALLYGATSVAIMFCTALLKEVWVTAFVTWWVAGALKLIGSPRSLSWLAFGIYCGIGVALRSTLLLLVLMALLLPVYGVVRGAGAPAAGTPGAAGFLQWARTAALVLCGAVLALSPWSIRNYHAYGSLSPLPHNSGVVLHQVYNEKNPESGIWIPDFVNYLSPSEIWRGYAAEAAKRQGRALSPPEVDRYWKAAALNFILQNPVRVLESILRKTLKFFSANETPINRSLAEERMFSPVLGWLPAPAAWLLGMGIAGLAWLAAQDRRWPIVAAPILIGLFTTAIFFAEDRFRFHTMTMLALCSGIWIDLIIRNSRNRRKQALAFAVAAAAVSGASVALGTANPPPPIHWDHIVWGYIKMGRIDQAQTLAQRIAGDQPRNGPIWEALGYTAVLRKQFSEAEQDFQRAIEIRPNSHVAHYNLAKVLLELGDKDHAAAEAGIAVSLDDSPDYRALVERIRASR